MNKTIEPVNFNIRTELKETIDAIFDDLDNYHDGITSVDVYLKVLQEASDDNKHVGVRVFIPGKDAFAESTGEHFESTALEVYEKLKRQLNDLQQKDIDRRRVRTFKP